jgi:hypothetical protein
MIIVLKNNWVAYSCLILKDKMKWEKIKVELEMKNMTLEQLKLEKDD